MHEHEGFISVVGTHRVWYRSVGGGSGREDVPILTLHGGPGAGCEYLESLAALASQRRRVIFYDQLGCGRSDLPDDLSLWRVERFVEEVGIVREALGLDHVHLLGQSWGGMLAIECALTKSNGLVSLILASGLPSMPLYLAEAERLLRELPAAAQEAIERHEAAGTLGDLSDPAYLDAVRAWNQRYIVRMHPEPAAVRSTGRNMGMGTVRNYMWGPMAFSCSGTLKDWDRTDRLGEIHVPTLITSGRYDECTPRVQEVLHHGIAGSEWVIFEHSAHVAHLEEPQRYEATLRSFIERVEALR